MSLTGWRVVGLVALMLALTIAPLRAWAGVTGSPSGDPCAAAATHDPGCCGDHGMMSADCMAMCAAALPATEAPTIAGPASYALRYRDADVVRVGLTPHPEPPPPR